MDKWMETFLSDNPGTSRPLWPFWLKWLLHVKQVKKSKNKKTPTKTHLVLRIKRPSVDRVEIILLAKAILLTWHQYMRHAWHAWRAWQDNVKKQSQTLRITISACWTPLSDYVTAISQLPVILSSLSVPITRPTNDKKRVKTFKRHVFKKKTGLALACQFTLKKFWRYRIPGEYCHDNVKKIWMKNITNIKAYYLCTYNNYVFPQDDGSICSLVQIFTFLFHC